MTTTPPELPDDDRPPAPPDAPGGSSVPPPPPPGGGYAPQPEAGYGTPPPAGYGAPPPGGQPMGYPAGAAPAPAGAYADWPKRALSALIDWFAPGLLAGLIYRGSSGLGFVLYAAALAWALYNAYLGGQTGQSYGKKIAGTRLISESTGQPPGGGLGIGRHFVHILDAIPCYLGFLWPLWDSKRQTFADKLLKTVVVPA
jgi:uncharacterized RDD family membrane protein YckC